MDVVFDHFYPHWVDEFKRCAEWIEGALEYSNGDITLQEVATGIHRGDYHLWTCENAALVTQFVKSNHNTTLHLFLAGGEIDGVEKLVRDAEVWGRQVGCTMMTLTGREGWKKSFLKPLGFTSTSINMHKQLE